MMTPKEIKEYLDKYIEGQEDAKRAASVLVYNHERGIKENICFVGPSGCGKTEIFRVLRDLFPKKIYIHSAAGTTQEGFAGNKKAASCFSDMAKLGWSLKEIQNSIIVLDEFDKVIEPTMSSGGNIAKEFQREFLTIIEGSNVRFNAGEGRRDDEGMTVINTGNISFVMCGAFEGIFTERKKEEKSVPLGFSGKTVEKKEKKVTVDDLVRYGMREELAGRITSVSTLYALTRDQVRNLLNNPYRSPIAKFANLYRYNIDVSPEFIDKLLGMSQVETMGVRALAGKIQEEIDKEVFEEGSSKYIRIMSAGKPSRSRKSTPKTAIIA